MSHAPVTDQAGFDYIVVGAGSAGAVLAARLSEDPATSVCLIEAGPRDTNPLIHIPFGLAVIMRQKAIEWGYETSPQRNLNGRRLYWPRGKTLGGSSSINAMCYTRGAPQDYDEWAAEGASGWSWRDLLPYFKACEDNERGGDDHHGVDGSLAVSDLRSPNAMSLAFIRCGAALQIRHNPDFNGASQEGLGLYQVTQKNGRRWSTAMAYLRGAEGRSNLAIITRTLTEKITFEGKRATGVSIRRGKQRLKLNAKREVLLCAGAINSPQLLMLSGIGPGGHLSDFGIETVADRPGVGCNLQDHLDISVQAKTRSRAGYAMTPSMLPRGIGAVWSYMRRKEGLLTSNIAEAGGFVRSNPGIELPDVQFHFIPALTKNHGRQTAWGYGYTQHVCNLKPKSRGEIRLASANPAAYPYIDPRYLDDESDVWIMIEGVKLARRLFDSPAFAAFRGPEIAPGEDVTSDQGILGFIREKAETIYHPIGTCRMGQPDDPSAVVDPELRVIGVDGLRVIDASVMPTLIRGNTNAPTIAIAERAADLVRGRKPLSQ